MKCPPPSIVVWWADPWRQGCRRAGRGRPLRLWHPSRRTRNRNRPLERTQRLPGPTVRPGGGIVGRRGQSTRKLAGAFLVALVGRTVRRTPPRLGGQIVCHPLLTMKPTGNVSTCWRSRANAGTPHRGSQVAGGKKRVRGARGPRNDRSGSGEESQSRSAHPSLGIRGRCRAGRAHPNRRAHPVDMALVGVVGASDRLVGTTEPIRSGRCSDSRVDQQGITVAIEVRPASARPCMSSTVRPSRVCAAPGPSSR